MDQWLGLIVAVLVLLEGFLLAVAIYPLIFERGRGAQG